MTSPAFGKGHVYALDEPIPLKPNASRHELDRAMTGHVLTEGMLVGTYGR